MLPEKLKQPMPQMHALDAISLLEAYEKLTKAFDQGKSLRHWYLCVMLIDIGNMAGVSTLRLRDYIQGTLIKQYGYETLHEAMQCEFARPVPWEEVHKIRIAWIDWMLEQITVPS